MTELRVYLTRRCNQRESRIEHEARKNVDRDLMPHGREVEVAKVQRREDEPRASETGPVLTLGLVEGLLHTTTVHEARVRVEERQIDEWICNELIHGGLAEERS